MGTEKWVTVTKLDREAPVLYVPAPAKSRTKGKSPGGLRLRGLRPSLSKLFQTPGPCLKNGIS